MNDLKVHVDDSGFAAERVVQKVIQGVRRVWNDKAVGLIYDTYRHNVRVHTAFGERYGRDERVADTVQELAAFPDLRLHAEEVIWATGVGRGGEEVYISHRTTRVAHNTGYSVYGKPTGKRVCYHAVTDYLVRGDRIAEVWEVQDELRLVRQLGLSVREAVRSAARYAVPPPHGVGFERKLGQSPPDSPPRPPPSSGAEPLVAWVWHELWNRRRLDRVGEFYAPDYRFFGPSGTRLGTRDGFMAYVLEVLAAFPDATVQLEQLTHVGNEDDRRVAVRWRLFGTHDGPSRYGPPTGRQVNILGITHHRLRGRTFLEEQTVFDELALLVQLHAPDGAELGRAALGATETPFPDKPQQEHP